MKDNYLTIAVLALIAVVAIQGYYLYDIKRMEAEKESVSPLAATAPALPDIKPFSGLLKNRNTDPFAEMERLQREMEQNFRNFDHFFQNDSSFNRFFSKRHRTPRFDMKEQKGKYIITVEIPGADKSSIDVKTEHGRLIISAKISEEKEDNSTTYYRHERRTSSYKRDIMLPDDANEETLQTEHKNGLLIITIDKKSTESI